MALVVDETAKVQQEDKRLCGLSTDVFVFDSSSAILKMEWRDLMAGERVTHTAHVQPFLRSVVSTKNLDLQPPQRSNECACLSHARVIERA